MQTPILNARGESRRQFLKVGLLGGLALSTISTTALLSGCSSQKPSNGFHLLRDTDLALFTALIPVVLKGTFETQMQPAAIIQTLKTLDEMIYFSSPANHKQALQLFDLLTFAPTRLLAAGVGSSWDQVTEIEVTEFFERWRNSGIGLFRSGYGALVQMVEMSWYLQPQSWAGINYEPPVRVVEVN